MLGSKLITISGPTASGKTALAINLAQNINAEIISYDSRQIYKELRIGVARPSDDELATIKHHLIGHKSIADSYSAQEFVKDVKKITQDNAHQNYILVGGTGFYLRALLEGLDDMPDISEETRHRVAMELKDKGLEFIQNQVQMIDPKSYGHIDISNPRRLQRIMELWYEHKLIYSELVQKSKHNNDFINHFDMKHIVLDIPRSVLYDRIANRVDLMLKQGLLEEVSGLYSQRHRNALQTVGYTELFEYIEGKVSLDFAIAKIKQHSRNYAKRQITWNKKFLSDALWINPLNENTLTKIFDYVHS